VLGGLMQKMWSLSGSQLDPVFPAAIPLDLGLV